MTASDRAIAGAKANSMAPKQAKEMTKVVSKVNPEGVDMNIGEETVSLKLVTLA